MIDILGLESEANRVFICWLVLGITLGVYVEKMSRKDKNSVSWLYIGVVVVAFVMQITSAVALFFTFQWGTLIKSVILGILAGAVAGGISYMLSNGRRGSKYARTDIMKTVIGFCKQNQIVGIICYCDRIYFLSEIADTKLCNGKWEQIHAVNAADAAQKRMDYQGPDGLYTTINSGTCVGTIAFEQEGYEKLPDVELFAKVLAKKLGGCKCVLHNARVEYVQDNTKYITVFYEDCFVYKKKAYRTKVKEKKERKKLYDRILVNDEMKLKKWE